MKRRSFIKGSTQLMVANAAVGFSPGKLVAPNWKKVTSNEMNVFLSGLDNTMNQIADYTKSGKFMQNFFNQHTSEKDMVIFRKSLRSLLLVGNFGDLSVQAQVHPGMQKRLKHSENEMNEALWGIKDMLKSLTPKEKTHIKSTLNGDPALPEKILKAIDFEAEFVKVPARRRDQLKAMQKRIIKRLKHSPEMFIDEYLKKIEKMEEFQGSDEDMQKMLVKQMGKENYETSVREAERAVKEWNETHIEDIPIGYENLPLEKQDMQSEPDPRYRVGKKVLGIGALITAGGLLSLAIYSITEYGFFAGLFLVAGTTVGPILIMTGLIILMVKSIEKSIEEEDRLKE